jgi:hypothetical protein
VLRVGRVAVASLAVVATGCAGAAQSPPAVDETQPTQSAGDLAFAPAPADLLAKCRATARAVGYPVPCPTQVPSGLVASSGRAGCQLDIIGPGGRGDCAKAWRGWVVGSSETGDQHLVITASPRLLTNYAKVVNGPAWYPAARVRPLTWLTVNRWRMRAVYAPHATNAGSAFADHVILVWTTAQHTYGVGFHNHQGIRETLRLNKTLARDIELVDP